MSNRNYVLNGVPSDEFHVTYVDKLQAENAKLKEVLRLHDTVIDELWEACDSNRHLEELIRDAWEKYKEVIGND